MLFDPTNDPLAGERHIACAWGRDCSDVVPLTGVVFGGGAARDLEAAVGVERVGPS